MPKLGVLLTYSEVYGEKRTLDDLHRILAPFSFESVLVTLGKINVVMRTWLNEPDVEADRAVCRLLFGDDLERVEETRRQFEDPAVAFTRLTVLLVCKQAGKACALEGRRVDDGEGYLAIGQCCLIANDLLDSLRFQPNSPIRDKAVSLILYSNYMAREKYVHDIARTQIILTETIKSARARGNANYTDLAKLFEETTGISVSDFVALVFGLTSRYLELTLDHLFRNPGAYFIPATFFSKTAIRAEVVNRFLVLISTEPKELQELLRRNAQRPLADMVVLQGNPCVQSGHGLFCLDPISLIEKASSGIYWILNGTHFAKGNRLFEFWGLLFEEYVNRLLLDAYHVPGAQVIPNPVFADGTEVCDAAIMEGRDLLLLEHKASILTAEAKYAGDANVFEEDVKKKLVFDGEHDKGVLQLANSIKRILSGELIEQLGGYTPARIFPVLVVQDAVFASPYINQYLNTFFPGYALRKIGRVTVTPVFVLTIADLEDLSGYLGEVRLSSVLQEHYAINKNLVHAFGTLPHPLLQRDFWRDTKTQSFYEQFTDEIIKRLFREGQPRN